MVPTAGDVTSLMSSIVQGTVSKDPNGDVRASKCLSLVVEQVRGAVQTGNRCPLSLSGGAVPPSGHIHTVVLAVSMMIASTPNMSFSVKGEFENQTKDAKEWLNAVRKGDLTVETPVDLDQTTLPNGGAAMWGSDTPVDLSTDGAETTYYQPPYTPQALPPQNLVAVAGAAAVALTWKRSNNPPTVPEQYNVYRGGVLLQAGMVETEFTDATASSGTAYSYTVTSVSTAGESPASNSATATPA